MIFMPKSYTLNERTTGPNNPIAVAVAGGSLTASTTYYYRPFAGGDNNFYWDQNCWFSAPGAECSATTTTTNKTIWIHFDNNVSGAETYSTFRTLVSGNYNPTDSSGNAKVNLARVTNFSSALYNGIGSIASASLASQGRFTFTTTGAIASLVPGETITQPSTGATALVVSSPAGGNTFYVWKITGTWSGSSAFNGSISGAGVGTWASTSALNGYVLEDTSNTASTAPFYADGVPCLVLSGGEETNPITPQDIYEYLIGAGKGYCIDVIPVFPTGQWLDSAGYDTIGVFNFKFSVSDASDGSNWFKVPGGVMVWQTLAKLCLRGKLVMGEKDATLGYTTRGAVWGGTAMTSFYHCLSYGNINYGPTYIYGSMMGQNFAGATALTNSNCPSDPAYQATGKIEVYDSVFKSGGRLNNPYKIRNSRMMLSGEVGGDTNASDVENASFNTLIRNSLTSGEFTYNNFILNPTNANSDFYINGYGATADFTITFHCNNPIYTRVGGPKFQTLTSLGSQRWDAVLLESFTTRIKVVDKDGNAIEGARITVTDKDGKKAIFDQSSTTFTVSNQGKTGTSVSVNTGKSLEVGAYYKAGDEIILVQSGSGTGPYTIARSQDGSSANNLGQSTSKENYFYKRYDYIDTDSDGEVSLLLNQYISKLYDQNPTGSTSNITTNMTRESRGPFTIIIIKEGYETYTNIYNADEKRDLVIELKDIVPAFVTDGEEIVLRNNPDNYTNRNTATIVK